MKPSPTRKNLRPFEVFRLFGVWPSYAYQLEATGNLPKRERGTVTLEYLEALATWHERTRGPLPPAAQSILEQSRLEHEQAR